MFSWVSPRHKAANSILGQGSGGASWTATLQPRERQLPSLAPPSKALKAISRGFLSKAQKKQAKDP